MSPTPSVQMMEAYLTNSLPVVDLGTHTLDSRSWLTGAIRLADGSTSFRIAMLVFGGALITGGCANGKWTCVGGIIVGLAIAGLATFAPGPVRRDITSDVQWKYTNVQKPDHHVIAQAITGLNHTLGNDWIENHVDEILYKYNESTNRGKITVRHVSSKGDMEKRQRTVTKGELSYEYDTGNPNHDYDMHKNDWNAVSQQVGFHVRDASKQHGGGDATVGCFNVYDHSNDGALVMDGQWMEDSQYPFSSECKTMPLNS
ncbi:unnamed protein product [Sympodiomycopsis kandeliae]